MEPKVSIVIPVYNASLFIERCINSILEQSYSNWELLLLNDGSTDDSLELCIKYQLEDSRITVVDQCNAGPSAARNKGISLACGKYIVFADSDDFVHELYLEKLLEPFLLNKGIALSCGGYLELSTQHKAGLPLHDFQYHLEHSTITSQVFFKTIFCGVTGVLWGKMFLTEIIKNNNIELDVRIKLSEDLLFVFEYVMHISTIALVKEHLYYYNRLNENGLSRRLNVANLRDIQLTNESLNKLSLKRPDLNFTDVLIKRYTDGVVNLTKDIAGSTDTIKKKIHDLQFIFSETNGRLATATNRSFENKIQLTLFVQGKFTLLIGYTTILSMLRNLKNKI